MTRLDKALAALEAKPPHALRHEWERVYGAPAPTISAELLRFGIAYRLQEKALGGLSRSAHNTLKRAGANKPAAPVIKPGTRLVRSWNGRSISVTVEEGGFIYEDRCYASLSAIAREVTGTAWSGPRFFGLNAGEGDG